METVLVSCLRRVRSHFFSKIPVGPALQEVGNLDFMPDGFDVNSVHCSIRFVVHLTCVGFNMCIRKYCCVPFFEYYWTWTDRSPSLGGYISIIILIIIRPRRELRHTTLLILFNLRHAARNKPKRLRFFLTTSPFVRIYTYRHLVIIR